MELDFLDGIESDTLLGYARRKESFKNLRYKEPETVDAMDLASLYGDDDELMDIFKKTESVSEREHFFETPKNVHFINKYSSPERTQFRNEFLLAIRQNQSDISEQLRYAYLTDEDARQRKMNLDSLQMLRKIKDKAEKIYFDAGGSKSSFRKAILWSSGNMYGDDYVLYHNELNDNIYADQQEYNFLHDHRITNDFNAGAGTSMLSTNVIAAIARTLEQVEGLFVINPRTALNPPIKTGVAETINTERKAPTDFIQAAKKLSSQFTLSGNSGTTTAATSDPATDESSANAERSILKQDQSILEKTVSWVSNNPGKSLLIAGALVSGTMLIKRYLEQRKPIKSSAMNGRPSFISSRERKIKKTNRNRIAFEPLL